MALPVIARDKLTAEEKREVLKNWFPPNNPILAGGVDLVAVQPANTPDPGTIATLPDGTTVRGISRTLLSGITLTFPPGTTGTRVPGATSTQMWVLAAPGVVTFPSKTLRVVENDIVQSQSGAANGTHTIHWHGIEPTPMNDGVGKQSFELSGFKYQFAPNQAGHYFYHCHKNTVLHFEMGLYGLLLVDPKTPAKAADGTITLQPPFTDGGRGCCQAAVDPAIWGTRLVDSFTGKVPVVDYDVEALWVPDDIDTLWHTFAVNESMANNFANPADPNNLTTFNFNQPTPGHGQLNDFRPDIFCITGVVQPDGGIPGAAPPPTAPGVPPAIPEGLINTNIPDPQPITDPRVAVTCRVGQTILIRLLNASYCTQQYTLGLDATAIALDGRPLGIRAEGKYSKPFPIPAGRPFRLTTARRVDLLVKPARTGIFTFKTDFFSMNRGFKIGRALTSITVTP
jgi:hypothetical protein